MRELPRDLVTILRTEARNQRTPPVDYVIAEDGGRMVRRPEPNIAMAELLEEAANALAARNAELAEARANRTDAHGWLFNNPDTGIEWLEQHPIESGEVPDAENVRPASAEEVVTLLREAWNALAAERAAREAAEAKLAERVKVKPLARAPKEQAAIGWTLQVEMLYDVAKKVADDGWSSPAIEAVEIVMIEAERRILSALEATPAPMVNRPTHCGGCGETEPAKRCIGCLADFGPASHQRQETADENC